MILHSHHCKTAGLLGILLVLVPLGFWMLGTRDSVAEGPVVASKEAAGTPGVSVEGVEERGTEVGVVSAGSEGQEKSVTVALRAEVFDEQSRKAEVAAWRERRRSVEVGPMKGMGTTRTLNLPQVVQLAMANNFVVRITGYEPRIQRLGEAEAWAEFLPQLTLGGGLLSRDRPQNTQELLATGGTAADVIGGSPRIFEERNEDWRAALEGRLPTGTQYSFEFRGSSLENTSNRTNPASLFSPEYESFAGVRITQPLLKDFGFDAQMVGIRVARVNEAQAVEAVRQAVNEALTEVLFAYYDFLAAAEEAEMRWKGVELSEELMEEQMDQLERGTMAAPDFFAVQIQLSSNRDEAFQSRLRRTDAQNQLLRLIMRNYDATQPIDYVPADRLEALVPNYTVGYLLEEAYAKRPDYRIALREAEKQRIQLKFERNQGLPRLDVEATYGYYGLAGSYNRAVDRSVDSQGNDGRVGLVMSIPLGPNPAMQRARAMNLRVEQAVLAIQKAEMEINLDIHAGLQEVAINRERLNGSIRLAVESRRVLLDQEDRLERGVSSRLDVLKAYLAYVETKSREIAARRDLRRSVARLWLVAGITADQVDVRFEEARVR